LADEKQAADRFYSKLFALDPSIQFLFPGDLTDQKKKLMGMFHIAVRGLDKLDEMLPALIELGKRHAGYRVRPEHYETMGRALSFMVEQGLGEDFTPEVKAAFEEAFANWSAAMKQGTASVEA
jgi:hemoglobin-like flavoprotein